MSEYDHDDKPIFIEKHIDKEVGNYFGRNEYFAESSGGSFLAQKSLTPQTESCASPSLHKASVDEPTWSAFGLEAAIIRGDEQAVRKMIEAGEDVNTETHGVYGSALWAAMASMKNSDVAIVKLLLDKGADINIQGGEYGDPLAFAAANGEKKLLSELISLGANVNAASGNYGNALQAASHKGHKEIARLLLDNGADANAQGGPFGNALQAALHGGHWEVVELLSARSQYRRLPSSLKGVPLVNQFVGRDAEMQRLEEYFHSKTPGPTTSSPITLSFTRRKVFVTYGPGGVGKTQLAIEFARRHLSRYSAVFWLNGSSKDRLKQSFVDIAYRLPQGQVTVDVAEALKHSNIDVGLVVEGVLRWLSLPSNQHWLLVIDNVDCDHVSNAKDPQAYDVKEFFPPADHGSILITSRLASLQRYGESLNVDKINDMQGETDIDEASSSKIPRERQPDFRTGSIIDNDLPKMDHLPAVVNPHDPITIPYLGGNEYDGLDFGGYPKRQNWQINALLDGDLQGRTHVKAAQFLQTWLYFGMLHVALRLSEDDQIHLGIFIRIDGRSRQKFITTHQLPHLLQTWHQRVKQMKNVEIYYKRFHECMEIVCGVWRDLMKTSSDRSNPQLLSHEVLLSIQILGAALDAGITSICGSGADYTWRIVPRSTWLMQRMISQGWCPNIVEQISRPCATFLYYASLLGPPRPGADHSGCSAQGRACLAANLKDGDRYVTKHVLEGCECEHVVISAQEGSLVADAIESGDIPVIHLRDDGTNLVVGTERYKASKPIDYIAISHV
ncbi:hypothetical protein LTR28_009141 [Elasticomyces elasticus]|nr:hypothetical protein LTR28_009141 [Elasticomyces elasticus]